MRYARVDLTDRGRVRPIHQNRKRAAVGVVLVMEDLERRSLFGHAGRSERCVLPLTLRDDRLGLKGRGADRGFEPADAVFQGSTVPRHQLYVAVQPESQEMKGAEKPEVLLLEHLENVGNLLGGGAAQDDFTACAGRGGGRMLKNGNVVARVVIEQADRDAVFIRGEPAAAAGAVERSDEVHSVTAE